MIKEVCASMTRVVLAGGGDAEESKLIDQQFARSLPRGRMVFIPHAVAPKTWTFEKAFEWVKKPAAFSGIRIEMWTDLAEYAYSDLDEFDAIYLMGGNTFDLLYQLRNADFLSKIAAFMQSGRTIYGVSAGAIVLGHEIGPAALGPERDLNEVGIDDLHGLDVLSGANVLTHYTANQNDEVLAYLSKHPAPLIAIPERSGVILDGDSYACLGTEPVFLYSRGQRRTIDPGKQFSVLP